MKTTLFMLLLLTAVSISLGTHSVAQAAGTLAPASALAQSSPTLQGLITVADVEKVSGLTGIKQEVQGDRVNFLTQDNKKVLEVQIHSHFGDRLYKQTKATSLNVHASVSGIGDDAFDGPSDSINMGVTSPDGKKQPYLLWFLKGSTSVYLATHASTSHPQFYLSQDKLRALARIIASRL
jgi:alpha-glucosidase (family GH31 glycosyl hydrolase)